MQQKPPIKYLLCTYQFQSNIELDSKTIMSIFQYYIGQPYWGHEAIKQVMYLQTPSAFQNLKRRFKVQRINDYLFANKINISKNIKSI